MFLHLIVAAGSVRLLRRMKGGRMLAGTTYPVTINVSVVSLSAFERDWAGECRREYMACANKR